MSTPVSDIGRLLLVLGAVFLILGALFLFGGRWFGWGRLPGDIAIRGERFHFYFPLTTCLLISLAVTLILFLLRTFFPK